MFALNFIPPLQAVNNALIERSGIRLFMLRCDLNHKNISGNKWYKLKYNLEEARAQKKEIVLTFGGAFSNHIAATAAAGKEYGFKTIGIIRGDELEELNPTLKFATENGMRLHFVSREEYKRKNEASFLEEIEKQFNAPYMIPEGGANDLGVKGCSEITSSIQVPFDHICCPCGTGTTLAGIIRSLQNNQNAIGYQVLKADGYIRKEVEGWLDGSGSSDWKINEDYHFGGYAKSNAELISFAKQFEKEQGIPLDLIYTAKMMFGIFDGIQKGHFKRGETLIVIHTGGLQGNSGFYKDSI